VNKLDIKDGYETVANAWGIYLRKVGKFKMFQCLDETDVFCMLNLSEDILKPYLKENE
jgi:hypothetical protein